MKKVFVFLFVILIIVLTIFGVFYLTDCSNKTVKSVFEQSGSKYVLKDEKGIVLLDNIKTHGEFCNGNTFVEVDNKYGIIDGDGNYVVELGKYSYVYQLYNKNPGVVYQCFYKVNDNNQYMYLKYDGNLLFKDDNDKDLKNNVLHTMGYTNKIAILETSTKYIIYNYLGEELDIIDRIDDSKYEIGTNNVGSYLFTTIHYNNKTYIFRNNDGKLLFDGVGNYIVSSINDIDTNIYGEDYILIRDEKTLDIKIIDKRGKITFETKECSNAFFIDGEIRCSNGNNDSYFDIKGNLINN